MWLVTWKRKDTVWSGEVETECVAFERKEDALAYKNRLNEANALIGNTWGTKIEIESDCREEENFNVDCEVEPQIQQRSRSNRTRFQGILKKIRSRFLR